MDSHTKLHLCKLNNTPGLAHARQHTFCAVCSSGLNQESLVFCRCTTRHTNKSAVHGPASPEGSIRALAHACTLNGFRFLKALFSLPAALLALDLPGSSAACSAGATCSRARAGAEAAVLSTRKSICGSMALLGSHPHIQVPNVAVHASVALLTA